MKLKMVLTWVVVVGLLIGLGVLYASNQKQAAELAQLRADSQELQKLKAAAEEAKQNQAQTENTELARLRKDNEELLRLRNEVGQLRRERQQLAGQVQTAQAQAAGAHAQAQAQMQAMRATAQPGVPPPTAALTPEQQAFQARYGLAVTPEQAQINACLNNLRQIAAAKQQWALANGRPVGGLVGLPDITAFLPSNTVPVCPAGGTYTINPIGINPICSNPNHVLPK